MRLHVITDASSRSRYAHAEMAGIAAEAGADVVQFREKRGWPTARLVATAQEMRARLADRGTQLIVNDRVDVARACGADGVHLGAQDLDPVVARRLLGDGSVIGVTAGQPDALMRVPWGLVSYVGIGPVFGTDSKQGASSALGLERLRELVRIAQRPVIAIGNVTADRVPELFEAGVDGVAVLSAVVAARDPGREVSRLAEAIAEVLQPGRDRVRSSG